MRQTLHLNLKNNLLGMRMRFGRSQDVALSFFIFVFFIVLTPSAFAVDLDDKALAVAEQVHTGRIVCEMGNVVQITPDAQNRGVFFVADGQAPFPSLARTQRYGCYTFRRCESGRHVVATR